MTRGPGTPTSPRGPPKHINDYNPGSVGQDYPMNVYTPRGTNQHTRVHKPRRTRNNEFNRPETAQTDMRQPTKSPTTKHYLRGTKRALPTGSPKEPVGILWGDLNDVIYATKIHEHPISQDVPGHQRAQGAFQSALVIIMWGPVVKTTPRLCTFPPCWAYSSKRNQHSQWTR